MYSILFRICDINLQNRIEVEPKYQEMAKRNRYFSLKLYALIKRICNESTAAAGEDSDRNMTEALFNFILVRGEEYNSSPEYIKAYQHKKNARLELANKS